MYLQKVSSVHTSSRYVKKNLLVGLNVAEDIDIMPVIFRLRI